MTPTLRELDLIFGTLWQQFRVIKGQTGWRVRCAQVGSCGGFDISIGSAINKTLMPGIVDQVDFSVDVAENLKVEHIGMLSRDWGALVVTRLFP